MTSYNLCVHGKHYSVPQEVYDKFRQQEEALKSARELLPLTSDGADLIARIGRVLNREPKK